MCFVAAVVCVVLFDWACLGLSGLESSVGRDPKKSARREVVVCCSRTGVRFGGWASGLVALTGQNSPLLLEIWRIRCHPWDAWRYEVGA